MYGFMSVEEAKAAVRQLEYFCQLRPTVSNLTKLSACYFVLGDLEAAIPLAEQAFQKDPHNVIVATNLGLIWKDYGDYEGALKALAMAYEMDPEEPYARLAYAESLLKKGDWQRGLLLYNTCRQSKEEAALMAGTPLEVKEWDGKKIPNRLVVLDEGGAGDSITFCRYLPLLTERNINWLYSPIQELRGFYERASWCGPERLAQPRTRLDASHWTTTMNLLGLLGSTPSTVPKLPAFTPSPQSINKYRIDKRSKPVLGLCWRGGELRNIGRKIHSMNMGQAMRLVCRTDHLVDWVNLQHDVQLPEPVENVRISTWEDLAGLMVNLDAVVSVETGPMCLASALGRNLLIVLATNSDWRFLDHGGSPFYPGATIFRNQGTGGGIENSITQTVEYVCKNWEEKKSKLILVS